MSARGYALHGVRLQLSFSLAALRALRYAAVPSDIVITSQIPLAGSRAPRAGRDCSTAVCQRANTDSSVFYPLSASASNVGVNTRSTAPYPVQ